MIDIKGLNKAEVLKALYDHSHCQGASWLQAVPEGYVTLEHCEEVLQTCTYFDYFYGRVLKVDLSGDSFDERLYDRDCGEGAARRAINSLRKDRVTYFSVEHGNGLDVECERYPGGKIVFRVTDVKALDALIYAAERARSQMI